MSKRSKQTRFKGPPREEQRIGDAPIEEEYRTMMNGVARGLDEVFNGDLRGHARKVGWCLIIFNFGDGPGRANYISNADRADVVVLLKEQLARFEGMPEPKPGRA